MSITASVDRPDGTRLDFRARRLQRFLTIVDEVVQVKGRARVIDLGGDVGYWLDLEPFWRDRPLRVTVVNIAPQSRSDPRFDTRVGDCRDLPDASGSFDIVHSNSVIEHVGRWPDMTAFAGEVRRLAPRFFVQTPNYWFPLEPHVRVPFFHWMPEPWRRAILMARACGAFPRAADIHQAQRFLEDSQLLDARQLAALFPEATIERERIAGLTKSLMAVR